MLSVSKFLVLFPENKLLIFSIRVYVVAESSEVLVRCLTIWALRFQRRFSQGVLMDW
jgi:hypothetical protein